MQDIVGDGRQVALEPHVVAGRRRKELRIHPDVDGSRVGGGEQSEGERNRDVDSAEVIRLRMQRYGWLSVP